jgi:hypothetical protein
VSGDVPGDVPGAACRLESQLVMFRPRRTPEPMVNEDAAKPLKDHRTERPISSNMIAPGLTDLRSLFTLFLLYDQSSGLEGLIK